MVAIARRRGCIRAIILGTAVGCMMAGLYGGLQRMGFDLPYAPSLSESHGPLMICGMFGTLIALERAVALDRAWAYLAPALMALGGACTAFGLPGQLSSGLFVAGALLFLAVSIAIFYLQQAVFTFALCIGALCLVGGNTLLAAGLEVHDLVGLWLAFLVCTIAAERLELSRILMPSPLASSVFVLLTALFVISCAFGIFEQPGRTMAGVALVGSTAWLARYDVAPRTIARGGQARFMGMSMLMGYGWLLIVGLLLLLSPALVFEYDLILHAVFLGFVMSMVFGHSLIILPALMGVRLTYSTALYLPLFVLHASTFARILGDISETSWIRVISGPLTLAALAIFVITLLVARRRRRTRERENVGS